MGINEHHLEPKLCRRCKGRRRRDVPFAVLTAPFLGTQVVRVT